MSISSQIRDILRVASGPMTAKEIRESLDVECPADAVSKLLSALTAGGQIVRSGEPGNFTYLLEASLQATREPREPKTPKRAKKNRNGSKVKSDLFADAVPSSMPNIQTVSMPRLAVRMLAEAVLATQPYPMPAELRSAVQVAINLAF